MDADTSSTTAVAGVGVMFLPLEYISNHFLVVISPTEAENSIYYWYQGSDHIGAQQCNFATLMRSNWPSGTDGTLSFGGEEREIIVSKKT